MVASWFVVEASSFVVKASNLPASNQFVIAVVVVVVDVASLWIDHFAPSFVPHFGEPSAAKI